MSRFDKYTTQDDDDDQNNNQGGGGFGPGPGGIIMPPTGDLDDVTEMLIDYNERFKSASPALFRDDVIRQTLSVLISRNKPNPMLIGPAGVGKTRIVEEIARRIATGHHTIPDMLKGYTVYELPLNNIVAGAGIRGQLEERVTALVNHLSDPKVKAVLFIDEIHQLGKSSSGDVSDHSLSKVSQMLKPALARGDIHVIGATTLQESRGFDHDPALQRRFQRLIVDELTREQTVEILKGARVSLMGHYKNKVTVDDATLEAAAVVADRYSGSASHRPDSALTLLDRTMADILVGHQHALALAHANNDQNSVQALQSLTTLPVTETKLKNLAIRLITGMAQRPVFDRTAIMNGLSKLKGQDDVLGELVEVLAREQLDIFPRVKPTAWMLAGPSGVGKTESVKLISDRLTGQEPIRLNMSEYHNRHDTAKILGSPPGYVGSDSNKELPFDTLESNPYRVILLDEFEKASEEVHRLFLNALDEGSMQMASGKKIDFSKAIVVATTNAAREAMTRRSIGFQATSASTSMSRQELTKALQDVFPPELLGRFSQIVAFHPIDREVYTEVLLAAYERERTRILVESPRWSSAIPQSIDPDVLERTVTETYLADQGARPAEAAARRLIEDGLLAHQAQQSARWQSAVPASTDPSASADIEEEDLEPGLMDHQDSED